MQKVLLLDRNTTARSLLYEAFRQAGYCVITADDGVQGVALARREHPDLVLVNLQLPHINGYGVCGILRQYGDTPIIVLSNSYEEQFCITSLEMGANDFVTLPCSTAELVARARSLLRWHSPARSQPANASSKHHYLYADALTVDVTSRQVWLAKSEVVLTHKEFELLAYLMQREGRVISREELLREVWRQAAMVQPRTVDVHIYTLRTKIERDAAQPEFIQTVRGNGYRFQVPSHTTQQRLALHGLNTQPKRSVSRAEASLA